MKTHNHVSRKILRNLDGMTERREPHSLFAVFHSLAEHPAAVVLTGTELDFPEILAVARGSGSVEFTADHAVRSRIDSCFDQMLMSVAEGEPVYGCNTSYGARGRALASTETPAARIDRARAISRGIAMVDVGVGPRFAVDVIRAAILIRVNMLLHGVSGIRFSDLEIYRLLLNCNVTPVVQQYGGLGASGDLSHNCRVLNALRRLPGIKVLDPAGRVREAGEVMAECGIPRIDPNPKAGLALTNGDNFSSALAVLLTVDTAEVLLAAVCLAAMCIEVLRGGVRHFHPLLETLRPHAGQREVAQICRYLLRGSGLAVQDMQGHHPAQAECVVQPPYCLRGVAQFYGVGVDAVKAAAATLKVNVNAVSDNPLWVAPEYTVPGETPWQWVSGANFLASYAAETMDSLRKVLTQVVKLNDRHLARLVTPEHSNGLPPNLSDPRAVTQCSFKGLQIQSGMFDVYSSLLSIPVTTFFGVHEEGNQDITSHALTSGILALENLRLARYSLAQNLLALAQAVDLRGGEKLLAPRTQPLYRFVRERAAYVTEERPLHEAIESLFGAIETGELGQVLRKQVLKDLE